MNDDSQALLAAFDGVIDGTCTLVKAIETVSVLAATLDSGSSSSSGPPIAPSSSSPEKEDASNLLDLLDSSPSEDTSVVWNKPAVPALKSPQYSSSSFTLRPPPSEAPPAAKAIFDPFDTDPFGPGTSSIDDLLSSSSSSTAAPQKVFAPQTSDMFAGMSGLSISGQVQGQEQAQDRTTPLSTAPTSETVQSMDTASASVASKPTVDLNALIFSSKNNNTSSAFPGYYGQGMQQQQQQQQQFPQQPQQWQGISSPIPMPMPNNSYQYPLQQAPYQQQQQQFSVSPPQGNIYSTSPHSMYSPPQIPYPPPPLPSSLPPPAPQYNAQKNPFDSF